jgi:hypothetical protein
MGKANRVVQPPLFAFIRHYSPFYAGTGQMAFRKLIEYRTWNSRMQAEAPETYDIDAKRVRPKMRGNNPD